MRYVMLLLFASLFLFPSFSVAGPVYKWEDREGVVHYSNKQPHQNAKPVDLPPIMRGEVRLTDRKLASCDKHGGVNCSLGADGDGSIICYDGFREASARFRFTCNAPKLEIADVSDPLEDGSFKVFVRNSKSVSATNPALSFKQPDGKAVTLAGPKEIDPFGVAEFIYQADTNHPPFAEKPRTENLILSCSNCP